MFFFPFVMLDFSVDKLKFIGSVCFDFSLKFFSRTK